MSKTKQDMQAFLQNSYTLVEQADTTCLAYHSGRGNRGGGHMPYRLCIYRANTLAPLPRNLVEVLTSRYGGNGPYHLGIRNYGEVSNLDWGEWDAVFGIDEHCDGHQINVSVYVSSILRRPFTLVQRRYYESNCFGSTFAHRVSVMYDSSVSPEKPKP